MIIDKKCTCNDKSTGDTTIRCCREDFHQPPDGYIISNEDTGLYWLKATTMVKINGLPTLLQTDTIAFTENNIADGKTIFKVKQC